MPYLQQFSPLLRSGSISCMRVPNSQNDGTDSFPFYSGQLDILKLQNFVLKIFWFFGKFYPFINVEQLFPLKYNLVRNQWNFRENKSIRENGIRDIGIRENGNSGILLFEKTAMRGNGCSGKWPRTIFLFCFCWKW